MPATLVACGFCKAPTHYHVLSTATIHYRHHPHFGVTVTMVRKCSHLGPHQVQVALPSGVQILIPEWMLDEDLCRMEIVERPALSITALLSLRDLIDAQPRTPEPPGTIALEASSLDYEGNVGISNIIVLALEVSIRHFEPAKILVSRASIDSARKV